MGMNAVNNGYLGFQHVRVPRENMLMKNSKVLKVILIVRVYSIPTDEPIIARGFISCFESKSR
jgi:hypothetical protein